MNGMGRTQEELQNEWAQLKSQWQTSTGQWNDAARQRFEREFMDEYEGVIYSALKQMDNLAQVIAQATKHVS